MSEEITLDPSDPFDAVLIDMVKVNRAKRSDYAGGDWWAQNFYDSAYQINSTAGMSCEQLIATKQSRLRTLFKRLTEKPKNEPLADTLTDRAVYAVIAVALYREGGYDSEELVLGWGAD